MTYSIFKTTYQPLKADTHEGFCSRSMLQAHFEPVSTHEGAQFAPGACSQIFNRLNIVEHFARWKFSSRGWSVLMKSLVHTKEICSRSVPKEHPPGAKSLVSGAHHWWAPVRVYRPFNEWQASIVYANVQDFFSLFPGIFFVQKQYICF